MTKKDAFIKIVQTEIFDKEDILMEKYPDIWNDACIYWEGLKGNGADDKPTFTDNGKLVMKYLQELPEDAPMMKAKDIAEGMFSSSRTVSGAMRKLVSDGYVEKIGQNPVMYILTDEGRKITIE